MADIAEIGFSVDTGELDDAKVALKALVPPAKDVEKAADQVGKKFDAVNAAAGRAAGGTSKAKAAMEAAAVGASKEATAVNEAAAATANAAGKANLLAAANDNLRAKYNPLYKVIRDYRQAVSEIRTAQAAGVISTNEMTAAIDRQRTSALAAVRAIKGIKSPLVDAGMAGKVTGHEMLNLSRQFADIGVTAAMGMNPLMILIQQGPQIGETFAMAGARGITFGNVMKQVGVIVWTALAPLLPFILAIGAAIGLTAVLFAASAKEMNDSVGNVTKGMKLTEDQLERLKDAGTNTSITIGDSFKGFFMTIGDGLKSAFAGPLKGIADAWDAMYERLVAGYIVYIKGLIGGFVGAFYVVRDTWKKLPAAFADIMAMSANGIVFLIEKVINKILAGVREVARFANVVGAMFGTQIDVSKISDVSLGRIDNPNAGAAAETAGAAVAAFQRGLNEGASMVERFGAAWQANARKAAETRIRKAAGKPGTTSKGGEKTDAEKFEDIVTGANNDIAAVNAQIAGINLTAEAAARLANEQKLLNEAATKGIKLTSDQRLELAALAQTLTDAQMKLKNLQGFKEISEGADRNLAALKQQSKEIGLFGEALMRTRYEAALMAEATAKNIVLDEKQIAIIKAKAAALAGQDYGNQRDQFISDMGRDNKERIIRLREEASYVGLSADQVLRLRIENDLLAQARQKNIALSPTEIAALKAAAGEMAGIEIATRKATEALEYKKELTKGFVSDLRNGLAQGKSLWEAFGDAVINVLQKIADKMMDAAIENMFTGGGGGGGGGFDLWGAITGGVKSLFGGSKVSANAKGNAFGVVNGPTMFAHSRGLGVMGEAGPEAVMPLTRGPDGSLGVEMYGGGGSGGGTVVNAPVDVHNHYHLSGVISSQDVVNMTRQAAENTKEDVKRSLVPWLDQFQRDGAL